MLPALRDLPSRGARPTVGLPSMWSKISSGSSWALPPWNSSPPGRLGLSRPGTVLPRGRLGLPPSDDSLVGPLARHLADSRLAELPVDGELLPSVGEPGPGQLGRILGRPKVASTLLALPGSKSLFYFWD